MQGIGRKIASGAAWMVMFKLIERSIGLVSTVILARLLVPADFGLVAMAMAIVAFVELIQAFAFDIALIQNQHASREHYDTAWTLNIILAAACTTILVASAHAAAVFFGEPRVEEVIYFISLGVFIQGFENIGVVDFRKNMTFGKEFGFQLAKKAPSVILAISIAAVTRSYWALVIGSVAGRVLTVCISYLWHPFRPRLRLEKVRSIVRFSKWMLINNALIVARQKLADVIVGHLFGARALGLFTMSFEISNLPTTELSAPINRAVFPGYAKLAEDPAGFREAFVQVISLIFLVTLPAAFGIVAVAGPAVAVLLGPNWTDAVALVQILGAYGLLGSLQSNFGYVFLAKSRPHYTTIWAAVMLLAEIGLVIVGGNLYGLTGAAFGLLFAGLLPVPFVVVALSRLLELRARDWVAICGRPLMSTAVMVGTLYACNAALDRIFPGAQPFAVLLGSILVGVATYVASSIVFWRIAGGPIGPEYYVKERIEHWLSRRGT